MSWTLKCGSLAAIVFWSLLFLPVGAKSVFAHGEHGDAAPNEGGISLVAFDGFQVELLTSPRPPQAGDKNKIVVKIVRNGSLEPVRNGKVMAGVSPARFSNHPAWHKDSSAPPTRDAGPFLSPASEAVWAGNYTLERRLEERGAHLVRVALVELEGKSFDPPALLDFYLNVAPAPGLTSGVILLFLLAAAVALGGVSWVLLRSRPAVDPEAPMDLLEIRWLDRFVRWRGFQPSLQLPFLALTALLVFLGLFDIRDGAKNLATKLTWILWWPGIIFTFILVGRLWCVMCPFGTLNEAAAKAARSARVFPKALRNLWLATFLFVVLTWADEQLGIIRSPQMTAWLILFFSLLAIATGLFFQRRSFCRYLCPITGLQGLYSMASPVALRARDLSRCQKDCHQDCYRGNQSGTGCPMFEFPMTMDRNTYCNLCFECVKACPPGNLALRIGAFGKDLWSSRRRWLDESYLAVVLVGITTVVTAQMLTDWSGWISRLSRLIPDSVRTLMKPVTYLALTESAIFFFASLVLFPLALLGTAWVSHRIASEPENGIGKIFIRLGYMFVPVGLAMHLAHNLQHLLGEGPGIVPALQRAVNRYTPFYAGAADWNVAPLVSSEVIYWLEMLLVLGGFVFSIGVGYRLATTLFQRREIAGKGFVPFIALSLAFTLLNLYLLNQPMGMRHSP